MSKKPAKRRKTDDQVMRTLCEVSDQLADLCILSSWSTQEQDAGEVDYVVKLDVQRSDNSDTEAKIAAAYTGPSVGIYSTSRQKPLMKLQGHEDMVTGVRFAQNDRNLLFSSSKDKTVRRWDLRTRGTGTVFYGYSEVERSFTSLGVSSDDMVLCGGTESGGDEDVYMIFWDARKPEPLGYYRESHHDDITELQEVCGHPSANVAGGSIEAYEWIDGARYIVQTNANEIVIFHPTRSELLLTGSMDGLLCYFDINESCEDDALLYTHNSGSSISTIGWWGDNHLGVYSCTHDCSISTYSEEGDVILCIDDVREEALGVRPDYVVDCLPSGSALFSLLGTYSGELYMFKPSLRPAADWTDGKRFLPFATLTGGHAATVRCCAWDAERRVLCTGGEDGKLVVWSVSSAAAVD